MVEAPDNEADRRPSGWHKGRRRWDLPPNVTKILLALVPVLAAIAVQGHM